MIACPFFGVLCAGILTSPFRDFLSLIATLLGFLMAGSDTDAWKLKALKYRIPSDIVVTSCDYH
jgi:hypothetical protein